MNRHKTQPVRSQKEIEFMIQMRKEHYLEQGFSEKDATYWAHKMVEGPDMITMELPPLDPDRHGDLRKAKS